MRNHILLSVIALTFTITTAANAQQPDSVRSADTTDHPGFILSCIEQLGTIPVPVQSLNTFLTDHRVSAGGFADNPFGDLSALSVTLRTDIEDWMAEASYGIIHKSTATGDINLSNWSMQLNGGYRALKSGRFRLAPYLGVGAQFNTLSVGEENAHNFATFLGDSDVQSFDMSNNVVYTEIGTALDYVLPFLTSDYMYADLLLGLRIGYMQGLSSNSWHRNDRQLNGGPDMLPSGLSAWFTLGYQLRPRKVDSGVVARNRMAATLADEKLGPRWRFGVIGGKNQSWLGDNVDPMQHPFPDIWHEEREDVTIGATARYRLYQQISLQANLLYSSKGGEIRDDSRQWGSSRLHWYDTVRHSIMYDSMYSLTTRYTANYIELPVIASFGISFWDVVALRLFGGVYGAALVSSSITNRREYSQYYRDSVGPEMPAPAGLTPDLEPFDAGSVFGLGLDVITSGPIFSIELRGNKGFGDINRSGMPLRITSAMVLLSAWF